MIGFHGSSEHKECRVILTDTLSGDEIPWILRTQISKLALSTQSKGRYFGSISDCSQQHSETSHIVPKAFFHSAFADSWILRRYWKIIHGVRWPSHRNQDCHDTTGWNPNYRHQPRNLHRLQGGQTLPCEWRLYLVGIPKRSVHTRHHNLEATQTWATPRRKWKKNVACENEFFSNRAIFSKTKYNYF